MTLAFYVAAVIALVCTARALTHTHAIHALLYLVVSFFALALIYFIIGAPLIAALQVIIYAGAIMVLFVFVVMLLGLGRHGSKHESLRIPPKSWIGPSLLTAALLVELLFLLSQQPPAPFATELSPKEVSLRLFGPYVLGVEMASMLLLAGLVAAFHLGRNHSPPGADTRTSTMRANAQKELSKAVTRTEGAAS